jgi:hypothetical protein
MVKERASAWSLLCECQRTERVRFQNLQRLPIYLSHSKNVSDIVPIPREDAFMEIETHVVT